MAQVVAHLIGNEEVGSSSLLVSSWRNPVDTRSAGFFYVMANRCNSELTTLYSTNNDIIFIDFAKNNDIMKL